MTQQEFDRRMFEFRIAENNEVAPITDAVSELMQRKRAICHEMDRLNTKLSEIKAELFTLERKRKQIGAKYWRMKHELIIANPKV